MRVLVTGGAGFVGSHTCVSLLQKGHQIIIYDSFCMIPNSVINRISSVSKIDKYSENQLRVVTGDIRDKGKLNNVFKEAKEENIPIEAVIHFAGLKSVAESVINPIIYWDVNVCGTKNLLDIMQYHNCYTIIFSSSATVYGSPSEFPISEEFKINPTNPYGRTKSVVEFLLSDIYHSKSDKWRICNLRYFNPVGAHNSSLLGEDSKDTPSNLFPLITQVAIGRRSKIEVYGSDWETKDGSGVRDYIHVMDVADGHLAVFNYLINSEPTQICFNLGSGKGYTVLEIIKEFEYSTGTKIPYEIVNRRPGDVAVLVADISKSKKLLNWSAKRTLKDMCIDSWNWQRLNPNGYDNI